MVNISATGPIAVTLSFLAAARAARMLSIFLSALFCFPSMRSSLMRTRWISFWLTGWYPKAMFGLNRDQIVSDSTFDLLCMPRMRFIFSSFVIFSARPIMWFSMSVFFIRTAVPGNSAHAAFFLACCLSFSGGKPCR